VSRRAAWAIALVACLPLAALLTVLALPLWRWLEARTGVEAIGHSGPAGWCYLGMLAACLVLVVSLGRRCRRGNA
jgi:hypothetical protein